MTKEKALESLRKPPLSHNCAQAVAHAVGQDDRVEEFSGCGTGRAPDGLCGALYCAMTLAGNDAAAVSEAFEKKLGYTHCRDLKQKGRVPCPDCVFCAAEILEEKLTAR